MSWRCTMDERMKFVIQAIADDVNMSELCREFGISRKTGYKLLLRYEAEGIEGIEPRSRRPKTSPIEIPGELVCRVVELRGKHPRWGGRKLKRLLEREVEEAPSVRSIERILERCALTSPRRRRRCKHLPNGEIIQPKAPNEVWTIDFKGDWRMRNGARCFPLTVRDEYSRFILDIGALSSTAWEPAQERLKECFRRYGLPKVIRSDNGNPFACIRAVGGLTRLSAWWIKLGITPNRITPGSPQLNGAHERMHLDMMRELEIKPRVDLRDEQKRFDDWRTEFNTVRPHESLNLKTPKMCYRRSTRIYNRREPEFQYDKSFELRKLCNRGMLAWNGKRSFVSNALKHQTLGIRRENEHSMSVRYCHYLLGYTDTNFQTPLQTEEKS